MVVVITPPVTVAVLLERLTRKVSSPSTKTSLLVGSSKLTNWEPAARSDKSVLVAVRVIAPVVGSVLMALRVRPAGVALRFAATSADRSLPCVAERPARSTKPWESRLKVTLRPPPRATPSRATP
jgi:hypothetical protein